MGRHKNPKPKIQPQKNIVSTIVLTILLFLITIGDGVRFFGWFIVLVSKITYNLIIAAVSLLKRSVRKQFQSLLHIRISSVRVPPVRIDFRAIRVPRIRLPHVSLPHVRMPDIRLPHIAVPRFPIFTFLQVFSLQKKPKIGRPKIKRAPGITIDRVKSFLLGVILTTFFLFIPYNTYQWLRALPNPKLLANRDLKVTTKIFDRNGVLLYELYAEENRTPLPLSDIPDVVKQATIAIEDREFYRHNGVSLRGITRALRETVLYNRVQGGSTITQQLIKSAFLTPEIKLSRKLKEILLAFWTERLYTKNQILEMYLNQVPYGGTAWGIEAASQAYFGKSVKEVTLAEAALLAGLPAAPTQYSPFGNHPEKAFDRQTEVMRRMTEDRYITKVQAENALGESLRIQKPRIAIRAPHFVMYVRQILEDRYSPRLVAQGGLRVITSLDIAMQEKTEDIVRSQIEALSSLRVGNGAVLITNPKTGEILAMVGSKNYFDVENEGNVNITTSLQQPGSAIKVVNYAAALEKGFTAASVLDDSPISYSTPGSPVYAPVNYDGRFHGLVPLRYALGNSYNIPAVKTLAKIGVKTMIDKGHLMGIRSWQDESRYGLSLTLGGGEVTMLEMATIFGTLARNGVRQDLMPIIDVSDYNGKIYERNRPKRGIQAVAPGVAWIISNILSDNQARINAFGSNSSLVIPGKTVSVKTGTSNEKRDNWAIGYTPSYVVTVWVGNNDNSPMHPLLTSGVTGAAQIWHDVIAELLKDKLDEAAIRPDTVIAIPCYFGRNEFFIRGTEPSFGRCVPLPTPTPSVSPTPS